MTETQQSILDILTDHFFEAQLVPTSRERAQEIATGMLNTAIREGFTSKAKNLRNLAIRITHADFNAIDQLATDAHVTKSDYVRSVTLGQEVTKP